MTKKLRSVVIDDSPLQLMLMNNLVDTHPNLVLSGSYNSALEANNHLNQGDVDVLILDVEMPFVTGFEFLKSLKDPPLTILVSKKPEYALKAFEYNIIHYLLKPVSLKRFNRAIDKVVKKHSIINSKKEDGDFIFVRSNLKNKKVYLDSINWIEGLGDYIKIITEKENIIVLTTMKYFAEILPKDRFFRTHKSFIANLDKIEKFNGTNIEIEGNTLPLSRSKREIFLKHIES